ncbi:MAG: SDR family oxidoreductase [Deltaproteobacteria bacterium]|uniref:UDP-glucuronate decarboxylase n=1 Tax=Candidatus Zymogenus saltonus TaxID=2844893 RepID=A0A9D8KGS7_9DELT|nr:SDR family oxidoreductase [Candidatus Zymogenus saltonus]
MKKRVLITGGAGFIGSHLIERLMGSDVEVICLDNFFTGEKENIGKFLGQPEFELIRHDIVEPILLEVDEIYHLACPASPIYYQHNPVKTIKTNVIGTLNMLGLAKRVRAKLLLTSTSEVYGDPEVHPQVEEYWGHVNPIGLRSCYDEGKRVAESLMVSYRQQNDVEIRIARIFNTYGPNMSIDDGRVISNFIWAALWEKPITIFGDGSQTRSFCYVSDMVEGLIRLMESAPYTGPMNLGNPKEMTILEIAEKIREMTKTRSEIVFEPLPEDDPTRRCPDISKAIRELNWEPKVTFDDGIKRTIDYFRGLKGN